MKHVVSKQAVKARKVGKRAGRSAAAGAPTHPFIDKSGNRAASKAANGDRWLDTYIPYRLYCATAKLNGKLLSRLRASRINPARWRVLGVLRAYGSLSVGQIAEATLTEQPTVSRVVAQLEREGRVRRRLSTEDSRVTRISLTRQGVEAFNQIAPTALRHEALAIRGLSKDEISTLLALLDQVEDNIRAHD